MASRIEVKGTNHPYDPIWDTRLVIEAVQIDRESPRREPRLLLSDPKGDGCIVVDAREFVNAVNAAWELVRPR